MRLWQKGIPRTVMMGLLAALMVLAVLLPVGLNKVLAESNGVSDLSLYQRASELTREFATALAPGSKVDTMHMLYTNDGSSLLVAGNAGGLLGYAEILADDEGVVGWLMNSYTTASATITYDQLMHVVDNGGDSVYDAGLNNPFFQYAGYGEVLTEMGLISTIRPGMSSTGRLLASGLMLIVYLLANVAPFLFKGALLILTTLNPFKLFETAFNGAASADLGVISGVAEYVGSMYEVVQDFSIMFLLPLLLVITLVSILMFRKSAPKSLGRYGVQVFMLFAGLPLIGSTYTGVIEDLEAKVAVGSEYADYLILSSYVDFESWVKYSRLAPPAESDIRNPRYAEDEKRSLSDRGLILEVNGTRAANTRANALRDRYSSTNDIGEIFKEGGGKTDAEVIGGIESEDRKSFSTVFSVLSRHMTSAKYTSSDYDGEVSGQIQKIRSNNRSEANDEAIVKMFSLTASDNRTWSQKINPFDNSANKDWMKPIHWNGKDNEVGSSAIGLFTEGQAANEVFQFGSAYRMNIYNSGDLRYDAGKGYHSPATPAVVSSKTAPIGPDREGTVGGLSPIAMYNFLNTTFSNTGLTVYSPSKTASDLSRDAYAAVTFGGSGVSSFTRWVENFTVMLSLAILSIAFGVMMISVSIKNIPRILSGVFGTAFGSIAFATKLLISTAVLLIQVIGMIFLYTLSENIIMTLLLNFNSIMDVGGEYFGRGVVFEFLGSFLVTVVTAAVTFFMIKNMKVFREMMEEVVSNAITRIMSALDTGTGGKGLSVAQTTGGRIGQDGKLTDAAKTPTGVMALLGQAHDMEARREKLADQRDMEKRSPGEKLAARARTASDLAKARRNDMLKGLAGVEGKSLERELEAKNAGIKAMNHGDATALGKIVSDEFTANDDVVASMTNAGQTLGADGEILRDEHGNAVDANGNPISSAVPMGAVGTRAMVANDGSLMDAEGNTYTDEMGNAFYQNSKGQLVDADGNHMALDKDGVLQPVAAIPGHNGKPVSAAKEAQKLDSMRFNADKYGAMVSEQNASHYGLDAKGNAVDANGAALMVQGANNQKPVAAQLDDKGFITDRQGNRVPASAVMGAVDSRGFERVTDPTTGETYLQHKGDQAMKHVADTPQGANQNLTAMARQANRASMVADKANKRVEQLKQSGATPYAVMQAQRFADKANKNAQLAQSNFNQAMQTSVNDNVVESKASQSKPVTSEHVASTARYAKSERAALQNEIGKLKEMKATGSPERAIARQERKVEEQRVAAQKASNMEQSAQLAKTAGRSFQEVHNARERVARTEDVFNKAQQAYNKAVEKGASKAEIAKQESRMNKASKVLSESHANLERISQPPMGSRSQIDQATARYEYAQSQKQQAQQKLQTLKQGGGSSQEIKAAKKAVAQADRIVTQARNEKQAVLNPVGWSDNASTPKVQSVPHVSPSKSFAELASSGISTYADYSKQLTEQTSELKTTQSKLHRAQQRLSSYRSSNRPPQLIAEAEAQVLELKGSMQASQAQIAALKDNAQGLLKNGGFQPVIASRPIRKNGTALINQLVNMSHTQAIYDKLANQEKSGTITDVGLSQMQELSGRLNHMRKDLVSAGIREDALRDSASITQSTKHMQQSWESFVNGKSVEHTD